MGKSLGILKGIKETSQEVNKGNREEITNETTKVVKKKRGYALGSDTLELLEEVRTKYFHMTKTREDIVNEAVKQYCTKLLEEINNG